MYITLNNNVQYMSKAAGVELINLLFDISDASNQKSVHQLADSAVELMIKDENAIYSPMHAMNDNE